MPAALARPCVARTDVSAGRPRHLAFRPEMNVEVRHGFAGVAAMVDDQAEAVGELEFSGDGAGDEEKMAKDALIGVGGIAHARYQFFGDDQKVDGRLRIDVVEHDAVLVLVLDLGGDFAIDDFLEDRFSHESEDFCPRNTRNTRR